MLNRRITHYYFVIFTPNPELNPQQMLERNHN
jgi:hypothetical protein